MEEEEAEIARLEAEARGEKVEEVTESESSGEDTENTEVQATDDSKQEETKEETEAQEDDNNLSAEEKSFKNVMVTCVDICKTKKKSGTKSLKL